MKRREFTALLGGAAAAWPFAARAQQTAAQVVGWLHSGSAEPYSSALAAFRQGLAETGFLEGSSVVIDYAWAEDQFERLPSLAERLVKRNVALIFVGGGDVTAHAAKSATSTIPIVFAIGADPVRQGIVPSLSRPGSNITGVTFLSVQIRPKMLELIRELMPNASSIAVLVNPNRPDFQTSLDEVLAPASSMGLRVQVLKAGNEREIASVFATFAQPRPDALLVLSDPVYFNRRDQMAKLEALYRVPAIHFSRENVLAGSLLSYGANSLDAYREAGVYTGRILRGAKPADLPVLQPTKFELIINLKTAKALALEVPPSLLARADEVIE